MTAKNLIRRFDEWMRFDSSDRTPVRLSLVFLFGFLFSLGVVAGLTWLFAAYETADWFPWLHEPRLSQDKFFEVIRNAVTMGAALGVGITLFFSYRRQRTTEATQRITAEAQRTAAEAQKTAAKALELSTRQHELERERRQDAVVSELRSRYSVAAEQLGAPAPTVKLAGVFALATLADDWSRQDSSADRQTCIDLLLATYRSTDDHVMQAAIWRTVTDRFRPKANTGGRWEGCHVDFSETSLPGSKLDSIRIDGFLDFSQTSSTRGPYIVQGATLRQRGLLSFNGAVHSGLEFRDCVFESGQLDLTDVFVDQRILFQQCHFDGTYVLLDRAGNSKNLEFIACSFSSFPKKIQPAGMRKLKFVDCKIDTEVLMNEEEIPPWETLYEYPFDLIVRGNRYGNGVPEIGPLSRPGDPRVIEHLRALQASAEDEPA